MVERNGINEKPSPPLLPHGNFHLRHYRSAAAGARADSSLRRRVPAPAMLAVRSPAADLDLHRLWRAGPGVLTDHTGYTSIKELLASSPPVSGPCGFASPTGASFSSAHDIQIRNHLVKHAAYAYLQPTPSATEARRRRGLLRRALAAVSIGSCARVLGRMLQAICSGRKPSTS